jgi:putative phage-type endonuclease
MTPDERKERRKRCGATDVAAILGLSPYTTPWEVSMEKRGLLEPDKGSKATDAGTRFEAPLVDYAEEDLGPLRRNVVAWAKDVGFPLASSLEAQVAATNVPVECKTSGLVGPVWGHWGPPDTDEVPPTYLVQVTVQMLCTGTDMAYLYALLGGRGIIRYQVMRDESVMRHIVDYCRDWWDRCVVQGKEPERTEAITLDVVKRLRREPNKTITFDQETTNLVAAWEATKATKREAEIGVDKLQAEILLRLGDAEAAAMADGREFTFMSQVRKGYTVADGTMRVARVRKAK